MTGKREIFGPVLMHLGAVIRNDHLILSLLALGVGAVAGVAVIGFREAVVFFQLSAFGTDTEHLYAEVMKLPWWRIVLVPTLGGLAIGILAHRFLPGQRPHGVSDVIEASALHGGRMSGTTGFRAALVNAASIGFGASVGREGPAVHLGASLGGVIAKRLHLNRTFARTLLGCGVAAAVAGSFNAPIAGALFASEVVIGNYALKAFAPIVIASVTGTMISRAYFGDFPAFMLAEHDAISLMEFPAFIGLGLLTGLVATVFIRGTFWIGEKAASSPFPAWSRPAFGGLAVGLIATVYPHVLGVGYGTMDTVLTGFFPVSLLIALLIAKMAASMI
ncbi:MAG TPA: chloride channel protein, partial [Rhodospirillales bacterium]|nr:chloride channel protein [Rhodospirillales bacterium]